jgi:polyisoprenoid-binding protein YceI
MKKTIATALLAAFVATPALAEPVTYNVDGKHTFPRFSYSHFGYSTQQSRFNNTTGTVVYDAEAKTASVDITIDMSSVDTGSDLFNEHIQQADFLDTAAHPTATFKSTKVNFDGAVPSTIEGELTMKGVTRPVTLTVTNFKAMPHPMLKKPAFGADATTTVKRTDFNAGKYAPAVSDEVTISIAIEAIAN